MQISRASEVYLRFVATSIPSTLMKYIIERSVTSKKTVKVIQELLDRIRQAEKLQIDVIRG